MDETLPGSREAFDRLGDEFKTIERATRQILPSRTHTIVRVDGKAFHTYCRSLDRPFDPGFMEAMDATTVALCSEMSGAVAGYVQSDEISILLTDYTAPGTQPWFGGVAAKITSIAASCATAHFGAARRAQGDDRIAMFDARVFTIADPDDVVRYFMWRQWDAMRNSIMGLAQSKFSAKKLHKVGWYGALGMLRDEVGVDWFDLPERTRRGGLVTKQTREAEITWKHKGTGEVTTQIVPQTFWEAAGAPGFSVEPDNPIAMLLPARVPAAV